MLGWELAINIYGQSFRVALPYILGCMTDQSEKIRMIKKEIPNDELI